MKTLFTVGSEQEENDALLMELGQDYCCYGTFSRQAKSFGMIRYLSFEEQELEIRFPDLLQELPAKTEEVFLSSGFASALLVPHQFNAAGHALLDAVYDLPGQSYYKDAISEWQVVNAYAFPKVLQQPLLERFPDARFFHQYTTTLKIYNGFVADDQIDIYFTTRFFRVLVKKEQQMVLAQTYAYKTPLDVVYYLLKICYEFGLNQSAVFLIISGLVDQDSALYTELHGYFLNIHFAHPSEYRLPENELPHYYFTSLYNLAACASLVEA